MTHNPLNGALQTVKAQAFELAKLRAELARTRMLFAICDEQRRDMIRQQKRAVEVSTIRAA